MLSNLSRLSSEFNYGGIEYMNKISIIRASSIGFLLFLSTSLVAFLHNSESKPENDNVYDSAHTACEHGDNDKTQAVITDGSHHCHNHSAPKDTYDLHSRDINEL